MPPQEWRQPERDPRVEQQPQRAKAAPLDHDIVAARCRERRRERGLRVQIQHPLARGGRRKLLDEMVNDAFDAGALRDQQAALSLGARANAAARGLASSGGRCGIVHIISYVR